MDDGKRAVSEVHAEVMRRAASSVDHYLSARECKDPRSGFVFHMRFVLCDCLPAITSCISTCDGVQMVGRDYERVCSDVLLYVTFLAAHLNGDKGPGATVAFALRALCECGGPHVKSLFAEHWVSAHQPLGVQNAALWLLVRAVFHSTPAATVAALAWLPDSAMPTAAMLALLVRTPGSVAFLLAEPDASGLSLAFRSLAGVVDPEKRNVLDLTLRVRNDSFGYGEDAGRMCEQLYALAQRWLREGGVGEVTEVAARRSVHRLARSERSLDGVEWRRLVRRASELHERALLGPMAAVADVERLAAFWTSVSANVRTTLAMGTRVAHYERGTSAIVLWFYCRTVMYAFARVLVHSRYSEDMWDQECADTVETSMRRCAQHSEREPCFPSSARMRGAAAALPSSARKWACAALPGDTTSTYILGCLRKRDPLNFLVAQTRFKGACSVAVVNF